MCVRERETDGKCVLLHNFTHSFYSAQVSVEEAVAHTKQHYEGLLKLVRSELTTKHERERAAMAGEIRQLEGRVATILKEQQRLSDGGLSSQRLSGFEVDGNDENVRPVSRASLSSVDLQRLRPLVRSAMDNVKQDMLALVSGLHVSSISLQHVRMQE